MREIEFRGKTSSDVCGFNKIKDGEWVYGYFRDKIGLPVISQFENCNYIDYEIDRETLGQYTGLKDKNGKKIFEGDIIHIEEENLYGLVCFENCQWYVYYYGWIDKEGIGYVFDIVNENPLADELLTNENKIWLPIVGNIYDKPKLLEVEK